MEEGVGKGLELKVIKLEPESKGDANLVSEIMGKVDHYMECPPQDEVLLQKKETDEELIAKLQAEKDAK